MKRGPTSTRHPGGPSLTHLLDCIRLAATRLDIAAAAITAYDPAFDPDHRAISAARAIAREIVREIRLDPAPPTG